MSRELLGKTKNGVAVFVDTEHSHAATHLRETPQLKSLVQQILPTLEATEEYQMMEIPMGRVIGESQLVETNYGDKILYAKRPNRVTYARFVKNKAPVPCSTLVVHLQHVSDTEYNLFSAWVGRRVPSFPGDQYEVPESREFWNHYALVWETQEIVPGTETSECPW